MKPNPKDTQDMLLERIEFSEQQVFQLRYDRKMNELREGEKKADSNAEEPNLM